MDGTGGNTVFLVVALNFVGSEKTFKEDIEITHKVTELHAINK